MQMTISAFILDFKIGQEILVDGQWFIIVDIDLADGIIWGQDQDGGEHEITVVKC
jgi:hypothetical protein